MSRKIRRIIRFAIFAVVAVGVVGLVTLGLWNGLMPAIFGLPAITFWQALGLLVLGRLLFGTGSMMHRSRFVTGWKDLKPEERERFRRAMQKCYPHDLGDGEAAEKA
jgi:hypothetical protein